VPAKQLNTQASGSRAVFEVAESTPSGPGKILAAFTSPATYLVKAVLVEPINCWKEYVCSYEAKVANYVDQYLQPIQQNIGSAKFPTVYVRFGLKFGSEAVWRPWEQAIITSARSSYSPGPSPVVVVTVKFSDLTWRMGTREQIISRRGNVGSAVGAMWADPVIGGKESDIEATVLSGHSGSSGIWYQCLVSDYTFLKEFLLPRAANAVGVGGYRFYVSANTFRFRSPAYIPGATLQVEYNAAGQVVSELSVDDKSALLVGFEGASSLYQSTANPLTGKSFMLKSSQSVMARLGDTSPAATSVNYLHGHAGLNLEDTEQARVQYLSATAQISQYQVSITVKNSIDLSLDNLVNLTIFGGGSKLASYSGLWQVGKLVYVIEHESLSCTALLNRGEFNSGSAPTVQDPSSLPSTSKLIGVNVNTALTASSLGVQQGYQLVPIQAT
jgi:hypothetical protein